MAVEIVTGDLFEADVEALVNAVNCVGVMGKGIALEFKRRYPDNYKLYRAYCHQRLLKPGHLLTCDMGMFEEYRYIINFPTKRHWSGKSQLEDIQAGLIALDHEVARLEIKSLAMPALGCGLGGLDWEVVRDMVLGAFGESGVQVLLYAPKQVG